MADMDMNDMAMMRDNHIALKDTMISSQINEGMYKCCLEKPLEMRANG
jgi:hypothetical protein